MIRPGMTVILRSDVDGNKGEAYTIITPDEVRVMREADRKMGRWCDDAGETILYPTVNWISHHQCGEIVVVKTRGVKWPGYPSTRPKWLCSGLSVNLNRVVLFAKEHVVEVQKG